MSTDDRFEQLLTDVLDAGTPSRPPDRLEPETLRALRHVRRRPRWLALIKEPPMRTNSHLAVGSPTARVAAIVVATLLLALTLAGAGIAGSRLLAADGTTIVVDQGGDGTTTTITEAVAMAQDGDTILVRPGTYDESIVLDKDVTIRGDGDRADVVLELSDDVVTEADGTDPGLPAAFRLKTTDASLENLTLRGEASRIVIQGGTPELRGLVLDGVGRVYQVDGPVSGLHIHDGSAALIEDNVLTDTDVIVQGSSPTLLRNELTIGALLVHADDVEDEVARAASVAATVPVIEGNTIDGSVKWGIAIWGVRPEISDNIIIDANVGITVEEAGSHPTLLRNTISGSDREGISLLRGAEATIEENVLTDNAVGIQTGGSDATLDGNIVSGGRVGINIAGGSPSLASNEIEGAERGLVIGSGASPTLEGNTVCGNETNLEVLEGVEMPDTTGNEICEDAPAE